MNNDQKWGVAIGVVGLVLTATSMIHSYLIYQYQQSIDETQLAIARQNTDASAIQIFNAYLPALRDGDEHAQETFGFLAERFQREHKNPLFAELILHLQQQNRIDLDDKTALQVAEATQPAPQSSGNWTVVVHSYQSQNRTRAQRGACRTILDIQESWPEGELKPEVEIYLTQVSNSLAVTVGGFVSEADAKASAAIVRQYGIKDDAFAQVNRNWQETGISGSYLLEASGGTECKYFDEVQTGN